MPPGQIIDFMNVDVEGHGLELIQSNDWERFRPHFVVIEDEQLDVNQSEVIKTMRRNDYDVCAQNVIILGKINEYFLIDERWRKATQNS
jgi:hypothetical protein